MSESRTHVGSPDGQADPRAESVLADLAALAVDDVRWREGRVFSLAYHAGPQVESVADRALAMYASTNGLNADAFPSLRRIQSDVVNLVLGWLGAPTGAAGFMTSGGTESILLAVKGARELGRTERGITRPNVVLPASAHAAFEKAGHYFGLEMRRTPVSADWRADVDVMAEAVDDDTVLLVASAPQYPQGVVDPVADIAAVAAERSLPCHVDACMGGVTLHFMQLLGEDVRPWNFEVPGVTSMSVDLHKFGYSAKGASVIAYRTKALRAHQTFVTDNWLGGLYGSSGILGTKSGGPMAAAWAVTRYLGDEGYLDLTRRARDAAVRLADGLAAVPGIAVSARPDATLVSFRFADGTDPSWLADALWSEGWYLDRQGPPPSLHCTVNAAHATTVDEFVATVARLMVTSGGESDVEGERPGSAPAAYGTID